MAIISEQEEFLLKFRQEGSNENYKSIEVSVTKSGGSYILDMKQDKKNSTIKVELESLIEIVHYVQSKISFANSSNVQRQSIHEIKKEKTSGTSLPDSSGSYSDLIKDLDINNTNENVRYNSQADVIIGNGVNLSMLGRF